VRYTLRGHADSNGRPRQGLVHFIQGRAAEARVSTRSSRREWSTACSIPDARNASDVLQSKLWPRVLI